MTISFGKPIRDRLSEETILNLEALTPHKSPDWRTKILALMPREASHETLKESMFMVDEFVMLYMIYRLQGNGPRLKDKVGDRVTKEVLTQAAAELSAQFIEEEKAVQGIVDDLDKCLRAGLAQMSALGRIRMRNYLPRNR